MSIDIEGAKASTDIYVELFDIDTSILYSSQGQPGQVFRFTNSNTNGIPIVWRGESYYQFPLQVTGIDNRGDGTAPNRPQLVLSNANKFLLAAVTSYGNLIGAIVTRWRTFYKFTDNGETPNSLIHYPIDEWAIIRKIGGSKASLQYELGSALDRPGLKLPRKQILRDQGYPGVAKVRLR